MLELHHAPAYELTPRAPAIIPSASRFLALLSIPADTSAMTNPTGNGSTNVMAELTTGFLYISPNLSISAFCFAITAAEGPNGLLHDRYPLEVESSCERTTVSPAMPISASPERVILQQNSKNHPFRG